MVLLGQTKPAKFYLLLFAVTFIISCRSDNKNENQTKETPKVELKKVFTPQFIADSAYSYIDKQVVFGPRVPGTTSHARCADYLTDKLKSFGFEVMVQNATLQTFDKKQFILKNIIASYKPDAQSRILLCSHWDTRPWADKDIENVNEPFDGANDGASGVGVALEIAILIAIKPPSI